MNTRAWKIIIPLLITSLVFIAYKYIKDKPADDPTERLVGAMLGPTPIASDLHQLCDRIGGRITGTPENLAAVEWSVNKFNEAGVKVRKEAFTMPMMWREKAAYAEVTGATEFKPEIVSRAFSAGTPPEGIEAELLNGGYGTQEDFDRLGANAKGKFILIHTDELLELGSLFGEYHDAMEIEKRAAEAGVKGLVYMSSRAKKLLFRLLASQGVNNKMTLIAMARDDATRCARILERGGKLNLKIDLDLVTGGEYESFNVIGEIKGSKKPDEVVVVGAHLDSWGLGTGANDNGANVCMMIDIARQMTKLGIQPDRTIRFALWNGEEQCICGSWAYTQQYADALDKHVAAISIDIGTGRIDGFFTGGRPEVLAMTEEVTAPIAGLGPFGHVDGPLVGTDNLDFMLEGVPNLVGKHKEYNYCADYHSESDTYDKVDQHNLKINSAIVAGTVLGLANYEGEIPKRQSRQEIQDLIDNTTLKKQMQAFYYLEVWDAGTRGRKK